MAAPYLLFLYPTLFRAVESSTTARSATYLKSNIIRKHYHASTSHRQETFAQRYGPAAEQLPPTIMSKAQTEQMKKPPENEKPVSKAAKPKNEPERKADVHKSKPNNSSASSPESLPQILDIDPDPQPSSTDPKALEAEAQRMQDNAQAAQSKPTPLEKVLQVKAPAGSGASPTEGQPGSSKTPHLHAPPYVHHFDSFGLVKDLEKGGFRLNQAETLMKAVRGLLAVNLDVAKEGMVSKSDRENVC